MWSEQRPQADLYPPDQSASGLWLSSQHSGLSTGKQNSLFCRKDVSRLHLLPRLGCESECMSNKKTEMALRAAHPSSSRKRCFGRPCRPLGPPGGTYPGGGRGVSAACPAGGCRRVLPTPRAQVPAEATGWPALPLAAASPSAGKSPVPAVWEIGRAHV